MGLSQPRSLQIVLCVAILQSTLGFVLDVTPRAPENPKGNLRNVSLHRLSSGFLKPLFQDVTRLKISKSKIQKIDRNAFDYLTHLNLLELSDIDLEEEIDPQTFSRLPGLEMLLLRNVGLRRISLNLTHVQELNLAQNELEIFDGGWISGRDLDFLDLSGNKLRALTGSFANVTKLSMIDISKNKIVEVSKVFEGNPKLLKILASENKITTTEGFRLPWLKTLDLFDNRIATLNSESFPKMGSLEELVLAFNNIEHLDDSFGDLVELKFLNLAWNNIEELHPDLFRNNLYLTKLSLQGNKIKSLKKFQSVHDQLTHLDLSHNQLALLDDEFFSSTPGLQILDLSFNRLKTLTDTLAPLTELKILNLAYNLITMTGHELTRNEQLLRVNLSSNALQGGLNYFKTNRLLNNLDLSDNDISNFCDADISLNELLKVSLRGNLIKDLRCLKDFKSLCEIDLRKNPLTCGEELEGLMLNFVQMKGAPYKLAQELQADLLHNQCENLSLNRSLHLWNSVRRELCPRDRDLVMEASGETQEWESAEEEGGTSEELSGPAEGVEEKEKVIISNGAHPQNGPHIVLPIGWIGNDEMNKPNPMQKSQSERASWESIERNAELLNGFEDEDLGKRSRFSWYTVALILIGLSLTLTCFNLAVFLYIRLRVWKRANANSQQRYTVLHNEVYKNTTEPGGEKDWPNEIQTKNKIFTFGRLDEILLNFALSKKDKDSESARNVLISPTNNAHH